MLNKLYKKNINSNGTNKSFISPSIILANTLEKINLVLE